MKIYFDKTNNIISIIGNEKELPKVTFIQDCGKRAQTRYRVHWSSIDEGYSTYTDILHINKCNRVYFVKKQTKKVKIKL